MDTHSLLKYYLECLKFESYFSIELKEQEIKASLLEQWPLDPASEIAQKVNRPLQNGKATYIGFPIVRVLKGKSWTNIPLVLWEYDPSGDRMIPQDGIFFHQYVYRELSTKVQQQVLDEISALFQTTPGKLIQLDTYEDLMQELDIDASHVIPNPVLFVADAMQNSSFWVLKELQDLIGGKGQLSDVAQAYFQQDLSRTIELDATYHVVRSNQSQNIALLQHSERITIIPGPPGTGKTQTILNLAVGMAITGKRVLISSTNNQAVDNVLEKYEKEGLHQHFPGIVRMGNVEKIKETALMLPEILQRAVDMQVDSEKTLEAELIKGKQRSKQLFDEIGQLEKEEAEYAKLSHEEQTYTTLLHQLLYRIKRSRWHGLAEELTDRKFQNFHAEEQIASMLVSSAGQQTPSGWINKLLHFLTILFWKTPHPKLKKLLKKNRIPRWEELLTSINEHGFAGLLADLHDVLRYANVYGQLRECQTKIEKLSKRREENQIRLREMYETKIKNDRELLHINWQWRVARLQSNQQQLASIRHCLDELKSEKARIQQSVSHFAAFQELFPIMLTSNLSARRTIPYGQRYDLVIVDEASQCSIPSLLAMLQIAKRICLIGDEKQLANITSITQELDEKLIGKEPLPLLATECSYRAVTAFDRGLQATQLDPRKVHMLTHHYRCAPSIIGFSNREFYFQRLKVMTEEPPHGLLTGGVHFVNVPDGQIVDKQNLAEIDRVCQLVDQLRGKGFTSIGVVTPFRNQANKFRSRLGEKAKIGTIHTFQGGECDVILFSTVITPGATPRQIDFAQNSAQMINVAVTRAIKLLIVVGHEGTVTGTKGYLRKLVHYVQMQQLDVQERFPDTMWLGQVHIHEQRKRTQLLTAGQKKLFNEIEERLQKHSLKAFPKISMKDTLMIRGVLTDQEMSTQYKTAHFDVVIYERESLLPLCAIALEEKDPIHENLCSMVDFPYLSLAQREEDRWREFEMLLRVL